MDDPLILPDEPKAPEETNEDGDTTSPYLIPAAIIAAGALIAFAVMYSGGGIRQTGAPKETAGVVVPEKTTLYDASDPFLGNPAAPVTMVEFADFQCPFCDRFFKTVEPQIIEKYVKTGKVKFVYRDFAFLGDESEWAASAAECAGEQGKFWQYHDYLYDHQRGENEGAFSGANLKLFAQNLGLDISAFNACFDSAKYLEKVRKDTSDGRALGVSGTPANFINGQAITGAQPFAEFANMIDAELAKAR